MRNIGICKYIKSSVVKRTRKSALLATMLTLLIVSMLPNAAAYTGVPVYFKDEITAAAHLWAIIPDSAENKNLSETLSRGEFCEIVVLAYDRLHGGISTEGSETHFTDTNSVYIDFAYGKGIVSGYPDGTFREDNPITRQEMFKMIYNFMDIQESGHQMSDQEAEEILSSYADSGNIGDWAAIASASVIRKGIVKGTDTKKLDPLSNTTYAQALVLVNRALISLTGYTPTYPKHDVQDTSQDSSSPLTQIGYNDQKYIHVYGSLDNDGYQTDAEAKANMVSITINVWKINSGGAKIPGTLSVTVNKAIAEVCKTIFQEIYDGPEKFPIKNIGGYAWRSSGTSEHAMGLAIDINPNENYMIKRDGTILSGSFWNPQTSPYSIPADGDVVRIFNKYGFAWGGNAWRSSNDYMHFSYFGE